MAMELPKEGIVQRFMKDQVISALKSPKPEKSPLLYGKPGGKPNDSGDWDSGIYE